MNQDSPCPFEALEQTFRLLVTKPQPLSLDLRGIGGGLPPGSMPLDQLKNRLLHPSVGFSARNEAVSRLVRLAQGGSSAYMVGLAGVLLPGLKRATAPLIEACPGLAADLQAEVLAGLIEAVAEERLTGDRVFSRLIWASSRAARRLLFSELSHLTRKARSRDEQDPPAREEGHPDLVLAVAVAASVITEDQAQLIGETRIGGVPLERISASGGVPYDTLQKRRRRAELALVSWISEKSLSAEGPKRRFLGVEAGHGRGARRRSWVAPGTRPQEEVKEYGPHGSPLP